MDLSVLISRENVANCRGIRQAANVRRQFNGRPVQFQVSSLAGKTHLRQFLAAKFPVSQRFF